MKRNASELLRKAQTPVLVAAVLMPPTLFAFALLAPEQMALLWLLPLAYLAVAEISILVPGKRRVPVTVLGCAALTGVCALVAALTDCWWLMLAAIIYVPALLAVMPVGGWAWYEELPPLFFYLGIGLFLIAQTLAKLFSGLAPQLPEKIRGGMTVSFLVFAVLALLVMNRHTLNGAVVRRHKASVNVRRKNGLLVLAFFLLVTLIVATPQVMNAVWSAIQWIIARIIELIEWLRGDDPVTTLPTETVDQPGTSGIADGSEVSAFAKLMKKLFSIAFVVFFAVGIPMLLLFLMGKVRKLLKNLKKLAEKWNRFMAASAEDYEEEITDIRDSDAVGSLKSRIGKRVSVAEERKMPPRERIRYRYGRLLRKHPEWAESHTARENLPVSTAGMYEKARYSKAEMTEEEAKQFVSDIKHI